MYSSLASFVLSPAPMFILMGECMFHSNLANDTLDVGPWLHRLPGAVHFGGGQRDYFCRHKRIEPGQYAMLGTVLVPEMRKRKYSTFIP